MTANRPIASSTPQASAGRLSRKFALPGLAAMLLAAVAVAYVQFTLLSNQVQSLSESDQIQRARVVANNLWDKAKDLLDPSGDPRRAIGSETYRKLDFEARRITQDTDILKVKVINREGLVVFSTDPRDVGTVHADDPGFKRALTGAVSMGRPKWRKSYEAIQGPLADRLVMGSHVPGRDAAAAPVVRSTPSRDAANPNEGGSAAAAPVVRSAPSRDAANPNEGGSAAAAPVNGAVEVDSDQTHIHAAVRMAAVENVSVVVGALILVYMILLAIVWSAEQVLRQQHGREIAMAEAVSRAEAANKAKSDFLANMSHELRTPLNAIIGFSEIMASEIKGPLGDASYKSYVADISKSGRHLLDTIDRVLNLVNVESGTALIEAASVNIAFVAKSVVRMMSGEAGIAGVALAVESERDPLAVITDAGKVRDILIGLVSNGIKFTPKGGSVVVGLGRGERGDVVVTVTDTGIGIRAEDMPVAMAPFGHVEDVFTKSRSGIGLGLTFTRRLTELLGGTFALDSSPGRGTRVTLHLPDLPAQAAHPAAASGTDAGR